MSVSRCRPSGSRHSRGLPHFSFPCPQYTTTPPQNQRAGRGRRPCRVAPAVQPFQRRRGAPPQAVCGLPGGPFPLNRFARETRANRYAPLGARRRSGVGPVWRGDCKSRTSVGPFPRWFFLLIYRGLLAPFVRLRWRCYPLWPSALADMASRMVRTPRR